MVFLIISISNINLKFILIPNFIKTKIMGLEFDSKKFDQKQNSNHKKLQFIFGFAFWIFMASVVLMFWFGKFIYLLGGFAIYLILRINTARCVNCMSFRSYDEKASRSVNFSDYNLKRSPLMILEAKTLQCRKCNFTWDKLEERTGSVEGIAAMGRERKRRKFIEFLTNSKKRGF
jgi:hypothetical protein